MRKQPEFQRRDFLYIYGGMGVYGRREKDFCRSMEGTRRRSLFSMAFDCPGYSSVQRGIFLFFFFFFLGAGVCCVQIYILKI